MDLLSVILACNLYTADEPLVRAIAPETGQIRAEGKVLNCGSLIGTAEGRVTNTKG